MANCVIFCAGGFDGLLSPIQSDDLVIAADGGLTHAQQLGIAPQVILGDFDSLGYVPEDARVFPVEKDDTDAMLAVRHGLLKGCDRFCLVRSAVPAFTSAIRSSAENWLLSSERTNTYKWSHCFAALSIRYR